MARINLLPWRELERARRQREFLGMLGGAAVIAALAVLYAHFHFDGKINHQEARNSFLEQEIAAVDEKIKEIKELEKTKAALLTRVEIIQQLQGSRPEIVHLFDELARTVPDGVRLSKVEHKGSSVTINGQAQSNARVSAYMRNIDASDWLTTPKLDVIETSGNARSRSSTFVLDLNQRSQTGSNGEVADES